MKAPLFILLFVVPAAFAQIPVTDAANLANSRAAHAATLAKWVESINSLRTQIDQLNRQINIQDDIRRWSGNPAEAGASVALDALGAGDLVRDYGRTKRAVVGLAHSLQSLGNTADGNYRAVSNLDLDGRDFNRDALTYRRYAILDAKQEVSVEVAAETKDREQELLQQVADTLAQLKAAETDAAVQKLSAKLVALNGQLAQVEAARRREVDEVALQKLANDARIEQERLAAAELAARDDYLANQRVSAYMRNLKVRSHEPR
ncbi:MAG: hypothetical protein ACOZE5_08980 [Verrucomicrobiota bacterium]